MYEQKLISNYSGYQDRELSTVAKSGIKGLTLNPDFTFTNELTETVTADTDYDLKLAATSSGAKDAITLKDISKGVLEDKLSILAKSANIQAKGNLAKLQRTGLPLTKIPSHHSMDVPEGFVVERANISGSMNVSVFKPIYSTHGTIFAFWKPALGPTPTDINHWFFRHSNGLSLTITGLTPNVPHPFAVAFKGLDNEAFVWSAITILSPGD
jgi:hypothetical protein